MSIIPPLGNDFNNCKNKKKAEFIYE